MSKWTGYKGKVEEAKRSLAVEDPRMIGAASLLSLDLVVDTGDGRDKAIEDLARVKERYELDPATMADMLCELEPGLAETLVGYNG